MSRLCVLAGVVCCTVGFLQANVTLATLGLVLGLLGGMEVRRQCP